MWGWATSGNYLHFMGVRDRRQGGSYSLHLSDLPGLTLIAVPKISRSLNVISVTITIQTTHPGLQPFKSTNKCN